MSDDVNIGIELPIVLLTDKEVVGKTVRCVVGGYGGWVGVAFTDGTLWLSESEMEYDSMVTRTVLRVDDWLSIGVDVVAAGLVTSKQLAAAYKARNKKLDAEQERRDRADFDRLSAKFGKARK